MGRRKRKRAKGARWAFDRWPPFVVVVNVGHVIEFYAEFTRSGATYTPALPLHPPPSARRPAISARLRALWFTLSRISAKVTRQVAAELAKSLEAVGNLPERAASFLTRCLFSMFAEDVGLLPAPCYRPCARPRGRGIDRRQKRQKARGQTHRSPRRPPRFHHPHT